METVTEKAFQFICNVNGSRGGRMRPIPVILTWKIWKGEPASGRGKGRGAARGGGRRLENEETKLFPREADRPTRQRAEDHSSFQNKFLAKQFPRHLKFHRHALSFIWLSVDEHQRAPPWSSRKEIESSDGPPRLSCPPSTSLFCVMIVLRLDKYISKKKEWGGRSERPAKTELGWYKLSL
ncbi:hypothetical protein GWI33_005866 [Rhynchophorus ferrugineus]|uniref:Uncharacterized protein n=1 Tax=Rhynchophorus ferrugineus TaxID=354439 RepID=A0A834IL20_RHYFE|nr:hypothetical protein GWI33_005866 [Rhynchophorus ferrugineus]